LIRRLIFVTIPVTDENALEVSEETGGKLSRAESPVPCVQNSHGWPLLDAALDKSATPQIFLPLSNSIPIDFHLAQSG
jgi:hypothetical protein